MTSFLKIKSSRDFNHLALKVFNYQFENCKVYRSYCELMNINYSDVKTYEKIPFLPISLFKTTKVKSFKGKSEKIFFSSRLESRKNKSSKIIEICKQLKYSNYLSTMGSLEYLSKDLALFKKNNHSEYVLNEFFKAVDYDSNLITDFYNETKQDKQFIANRHDQSILSLLSKTSGGIGLESQTFFKKGSQEQKNFPFLSVRHYGHKKKSIIRYHLNYKNIKNTPIFF